MPAPAHLIVLAWGLWAAGLLGLCVLAAVPAVRRMAGDFLRLMGSEAVIVAAATTPILLGPIVVGFAILLLAGRIGWEAGRVEALRANGAETAASGLARGSVVLIGGLAVLGWALPRMALWPLAGVIVVAGVIGHFRRRAGVEPGPVEFTALARIALYPGLAVLLFAALAGDPRHYPTLLVAFIFVEVFDSLALFGGQVCGHHHLFPRLSPRKTVEGLATGLVGLLAVAWAVNAVLIGAPVASWFVLALSIGFAAVAGDLAASAAKRVAGVKDYPPVMRIQGGALDIVDAWLVAAPVCAFLVWQMGLW